MNRVLPCSIIAATSLLGGLGVPAATVANISVPGTADPWLAGMPSGSTASGGDLAPQHSPVEVDGLPLIQGSSLEFTVTGGVGFGPARPLAPPDGGDTIGAHLTGAENGIASLSAPHESLVGVFLGDDRPDLSPAPEPLDFSSTSTRDYTSASPALKQVFFIGDGRHSTGAVQWVIVPEGATRLFLGTMDGIGWYNNIGSFTVSVTDQEAEAPALQIFPAVELVLGTESNRLYQLQYCVQIDTNTWYELGQPIWGDGTVKSRFDTTRYAQQRFYRLETGRCGYQLSTNVWDASSAGGITTPALTVSEAACAWSVVNPCAWVTVTPTNGAGTTSLTVSVPYNESGSARTCTLTIGGQSLEVRQPYSPW